MTKAIIGRSAIEGEFIAPPVGNYSGDYGYAAAFLTAAAVKGNVICKNLSPSSEQENKYILSILTAFGAVVKRSGDNVNVKYSKLKSAEIDVSSCKRLTPFVALLALFAKGKTHIHGFYSEKNTADISGEEDILKGVIENLQVVGARFEYNDNHLWVWPLTDYLPAVLHSHGNTFTAMAAAIFCSLTPAQTSLRGLDCVDKRYPMFWRQLESLGADIRITRDRL